jgi:hypothetical protein
VPDVDRRRLAGQRHRRDPALLDQAGGGPVGGRAERHAAGRGVLLEPGRGGDHRAAGRAVPAVAGAGQVHHRLAGGHPDPHPQPRPPGHGPPVQGPLDLQPGPHRPVRVEAVRVAGAEEWNLWVEVVVV